MTEPSEKYKGIIPRPSAEQIANKDVAGFEKEVLSDPKYREAGLPATVAEIVADPERYETVLADSEFAKLIAAQETPPPEQTAPAEPASAIAVAPAAPVEEDLMDLAPAESAVGTPAPVKVHEPVMRFVDLDVTSEVKTNKVCGLLFIERHGLEEALDDTFPDDTVWGRVFRRLLAPYQPGGKVKPLKPKDGYVDAALHAYVVGGDIAPVSGDVHARDLPDRRAYSHIISPNDSDVREKIDQLTMEPSDLMEIDDNGNDTEASKIMLDLATYPRAVGTKVLAQDVIASPTRIRLLVHQLHLFRAMHVSFDKFISTYRQAGLLDVTRLHYIQEERLQVERERISWNEHAQSLYAIRFFGPPGRTSEHFYYKVLINEPASTCQGALERSFNAANFEVGHIQSTDKEPIPFGGTAATKEWVSKLAAIPPADASEAMRLLCGGLVGGYRSGFTIRPAPESMHAITASMCALANLAYMDLSIVTTQTLAHQLQILLFPLNNETDQPTHTEEKGSGRRTIGVVSTKLMPGVHTLVSRYLTARASDPNAPFIVDDVPTKFFNASSMGARVGRNIPEIMRECINAALRRSFTSHEITGRLFNTPGNSAVLHPFVPRSDAYDLIVRGEPAGNEPPHYDTMKHNQQAEAIVGILHRWSQVLATLTEFGTGVDGAMKGLTQGRPHLRSAMAVVSATIVSASMNRECLPFKAGFRSTSGEEMHIVDNRVRDIELPFAGWLAFTLHGVKSSTFVTNGGFIQYADVGAKMMPSMYPYQMGMERCVVYQIVTALRSLDRDDEVVRPNSVLELILLIMARFWSSPDPESKERVTRLLEMAALRTSLPGFPNTKIDQPPPLVLPMMFKASELVMPRLAGSPMVAYGANDVLQGATVCDIDEDMPSAEPFSDIPDGPMLTLDEIKKRRVTEFYITRKAITPMKVSLLSGETAFLYTGDEPRDMTTVIDLEDLVRHRYNSETSWTEDALRAKADLYAVEKLGVPEWTYIRVSRVLTTFKLVEDKGTGDTIKMGEVRLTLKADKERLRSDKFAVTELPVYAHMVGDLSQGRGKTADQEAKIMRTLFRYILVPWSAIQKTLVHFDGVNVDTLGLYTHANRGLGDELELHEVSQIRLRDGYHGITIAGRCHLTTRGVESYTIMDKLVERVLPGTI